MTENIDVWGIRKRVSMDFAKLRDTLGPRTLRGQSVGKLDMRSAMRAASREVPNPNVFRRKIPDNRGKADIIAAIFMDTSGSMGMEGKLPTAKWASWAVANGIEDAGGKCMVLTYSTWDWTFLTKPFNKEGYWGFGASAGNQPHVALETAIRMFAQDPENRNRTMLFITITDGLWQFGPYGPWDNDALKEKKRQRYRGMAPDAEVPKSILRAKAMYDANPTEYEEKAATTRLWQGYHGEPIGFAQTEVADGLLREAERLGIITMEVLIQVVASHGSNFIIPIKTVSDLPQKMADSLKQIQRKIALEARAI